MSVKLYIVLSFDDGSIKIKVYALLKWIISPKKEPELVTGIHVKTVKHAIHFLQVLQVKCCFLRGSQLNIYEPYKGLFVVIRWYLQT